MILELATTIALAQSCAPSVAPETMVSIVRVESGFNPYAIGINHAGALERQPQSKAEAIATAKTLLADGHNIDMGLGQINSENLAWLGLTVEDVFDPCTNLRAAAMVLEEGYRSSSAIYGAGQQALQMALSAYNTGNYRHGFANGYVGKVLDAASVVVPAVQTQDLLPPDGAVTLPDEASGARSGPAVAATRSEPEIPAWDVFNSQAAREVLVFD